ncbi:hypothetical protein CAPTEDRAFT_199587 [Capitella teleta]|uniref:Uncharacterized protein n=1 Tax=Capitella teleta TaxID=283909 RepID=R7TCS6_CAPTE|nr:hypothetical protein CAPTEDRAFT_199587 [Capitella teleta]|eukprot:ELT91553.1 hypothetical protein CAPTEDRAFT_199587 [Capitella teleta]
MVDDLWMREVPFSELGGSLGEALVPGRRDRPGASFLSVSWVKDDFQLHGRKDLEEKESLLPPQGDVVATDVGDPLRAVFPEAAQGYLLVVSREPLTSEWRLWDSVSEHFPEEEFEEMSSSSSDATAAIVKDARIASTGDIGGKVMGKREGTLTVSDWTSPTRIGGSGIFSVKKENQVSSGARGASRPSCKAGGARSPRPFDAPATSGRARTGVGDNRAEVHCPRGVWRKETEAVDAPAITSGRKRSRGVAVEKHIGQQVHWGNVSKYSLNVEETKDSLLIESLEETVEAGGARRLRPFDAPATTSGMIGKRFAGGGAYGVYDLETTKHEMDTMVEALHKVSLEYGLDINPDKTQVMRIGNTGTIEIQG